MKDKSFKLGFAPSAQFPQKGIVINMIKGLNHIGVVVSSIDETLKKLSDAFGAVECGAEGRKSYPEMGQTSALVRLGDFTIELMEPCGDIQGVPSKFLEKRGEGLHHISLITDDVDAQDEHLLSAGVHVIGKSPKDANGKGVMFTHPKETCGIVFEITDVIED